MSSDPFPKKVEHPDGRQLTVTSLSEQDAAARQGYLRRIARNRARADAAKDA